MSVATAPPLPGAAADCDPSVHSTVQDSGHGDSLGKSFDVEDGKLAGGGSSDDIDVLRRGTWLTGYWHVITAVIGAGVLALPYAVGVLGWVGGPICMLLFGYITLHTSLLLADCYFVDGKRNLTYADAVGSILGRWGSISIMYVQYINLVLTALAYTITSGLTLQAFARSMCVYSGTEEGSCFDTYWKWAVIFGAIELVLVQLPDLHHFWWASIIGALMSFGYCLIAAGMGLGNASHAQGSVAGIQFDSNSTKAFEVLNAMGSILFAFSFSMILVEIQDCLRTPSGDEAVGPVKPMRRAVNLGVATMTCFYLVVGISGYAALGQGTPYNILDGGFNSDQVPQWVIDAANMMVLIHLIPAYQVWSLPFQLFAEKCIEGISGFPDKLKGWPLRLIFRSTYVVVLTFLAILLPFFGYIVGLCGALGFWPASVFFPILMWIKVYKPSPGYKWYLQGMNLVSFAISVAAVVGSVQLIVVAWKDFQLFEA